MNNSQLDGYYLFKNNRGMNLNDLKSEELKKLCSTNKLKSLFAFGYVAREDFNEDSDIDLVVNFNENDPFKYTDIYFNLKEKLETLFNRQVDLLEERAIRNRLFRQQLDSTKIQIYGY